MSNNDTSKQTPSDLPPIGSKVKIQCSHKDCPEGLAERKGPEFVKGWEAFFAGSPDPEVNEEWGEWGEWDRSNPFVDGWKLAKRAKSGRECHEWTLSAVEQDESGEWVAVLTRQEVNSYNDVMNGSGTGLGHHTVTERVQLTGKD